MYTGNEVAKARMLLIQHHVAVTEQSIQSGDFGDPSPKSREGSLRIDGIRNNLVGYYTLQVLNYSFEQLHDAIYSVLESAKDRKFGLNGINVKELYDSWMFLRDKLPDDYYPEWLR